MVNERSNKILLLAFALLVFGATQAYAAVSGARLWVATYDRKLDVPSDIVSDKINNVFVTGASGSDYATIKYGPGGVRK